MRDHKRSKIGPCLMWHERSISFDYDIDVLTIERIESGKRYHYYIKWTLPYANDRSDISHMTRTCTVYSVQTTNCEWLAEPRLAARCGKAKWYKLRQTKIDTQSNIHSIAIVEWMYRWNSIPKMNEEKSSKLNINNV